MAELPPPIAPPTDVQEDPGESRRRRRPSATVAILLLIALAFAGGAVIDRSVGDSEDSSVNSPPDVVEEIDDLDDDEEEPVVSESGSDETVPAAVTNPSESEFAFTIGPERTGPFERIDVAAVAVHDTQARKQRGFMGRWVGGRAGAESRVGRLKRRAGVGEAYCFERGGHGLNSTKVGRRPRCRRGRWRLLC